MKAVGTDGAAGNGKGHKPSRRGVTVGSAASLPDTADIAATPCCPASPDRALIAVCSTCRARFEGRQVHKQAAVHADETGHVSEVFAGRTFLSTVLPSEAWHTPEMAARMRSTARMSKSQFKRLAVQLKSAAESRT